MDYYTILGISKSANQEDIKNAYRKLAMKHHPDRNQGNKEAEDRFKKINEAYATLSDVTKRRDYDRVNESTFNGFKNSHTHTNNQDFKNTSFEDEDIDEMMKNFFNQKSPFSDIFGQHFQQKSQQRRAYAVNLNFWEAIFGAEKQFEFMGDNNSRFSVRITFPPGLDDGTMLEVSINTGQKILLHISVTPDKNFTRDNLDLYASIDIPLSKVLLGGSIKFPHWEKEYEIEIPAGTQQGQLLRLSNAGIKKDIFSGDLYLKCNIIIPKKLTKKQKEILGEYAKTEKENTSFFDGIKNSWSKFFNK